MKKILTFIFCLLIFLFLPSKVFAQALINEFSVNPPDKQDWVELYSPETIDISNWKLADETGDYHTFPSGSNLGPGIYLVVNKYQRLDNDKDTIKLINSSGQIIDSIRYGYVDSVCLPSIDGSIARIPDGSNLIDRLLINTGGVTNGNSVTDPCPIIIPSSTPTETPATPTPTPIVTSTPTPTKTASPTPRPTPGSAPSANSKEETESTNSLIMGLRNELAPSATPGAKEEKTKGNFPIIPVILIGGGIICLIGSGAALVKKMKTDYNEKEDVGEKNFDNS